VQDKTLNLLDDVFMTIIERHICQIYQGQLYQLLVSIGKYAYTAQNKTIAICSRFIVLIANTVYAFFKYIIQLFVHGYLLAPLGLGVLLSQCI